MLRDQKAIDFFSNKVVLTKINGKEDTVLAQTYKISAYPTSVLINKDGVEIDRIVGYAEVDEFLKNITDYQQGIGTLDDLLGKIEVNFTREMAYEIADKYKYRSALEEAKIWYKKVIETGEFTDSLSGECRMSLANMYYRNKDYDKSISNYKSIIKDFKDSELDEIANIWIGLAILKKGDTTNAITQFENFVKEFPNSEDIEYVEGRLRGLKGIPEKNNN